MFSSTGDSTSCFKNYRISGGAFLTSSKSILGFEQTRNLYNLIVLCNASILETLIYKIVLLGYFIYQYRIITVNRQRDFTVLYKRLWNPWLNLKSIKLCYVLQRLRIAHFGTLPVCAADFSASRGWFCVCLQLKAASGLPDAAFNLNTVILKLIWMRAGSVKNNNFKISLID